jgi:LysR family transcriptional regulator, hydrogen peroxide-inducible genes activator
LEGEKLSMATISQLEYALAVARTGHFGKAAKQCFVTQPTLSHMIKLLEEELGLLLFDRTQKPIVPTVEGKEIIYQSQKVLHEMQILDSISKKKLQVIEGELKLAIIPTVAPYLLPLFFKKFTESYPQINLFVEELSTERIVHSLKQGNIDVAIAALPLPNFYNQPIYKEELFVFANKYHSFFKKNKINQNELSLNELLLLGSEHCLSGQMESLCAFSKEKNFQKNSVHRTEFKAGSVETIIRLVQSGPYASIIPYLSVPKVSQLENKELVKVIPFGLPVPVREIGLVSLNPDFKQRMVEALEKTIEQNLPKELKSMRKQNTVIDVSKK